MFRPLILDFLDVMLPTAAAFGALAVGRYLNRVEVWVFRVVVSVVVSVVLLLGLSYFTPIHAYVSDGLWWMGGLTTIMCTAAMLLIGIVWSSEERSTSTAFLRTIVALVMLIIALTSGGRLWWRFFAEVAWNNSPDQAGLLKQSSGWTCSPAVAAMLLHHHGIQTTEGEMAYLANTSFLGTDAPSIARALTVKADQTFDALILRADYGDCLRQPTPFLACIHVPRLGGHAVLVLSVDDSAMELVDPRFGQKQRMPRSEVEKQWDGTIVILRKSR
ncbi:MAG: hypothetical protein FJ303_20460 [Planctomycetes bacterium]|nr:hypothetical protein [Planctomycetota bacterium]